jgi:hypothetical protein
MTQRYVMALYAYTYTAAWKQYHEQINKHGSENLYILVSFIFWFINKSFSLRNL